ncbi:MAG: hypothetical protein IKT78_02850, partial [Ruminiclostridium sp.]|nr:hypothetical protein [Ruminiclostridium sp.]
MGKYTDCGRELENGVGSEKDNPVYKIICQSVSKKLFLLAIIAFSVAVILNLIEVFSYSISFESPFYSIFLRVGVNAEFFVDLFFQLFRIIYVVPPIVIAVSMWITYFTIKTSQSGIKILR